MDFSKFLDAIKLSPKYLIPIFLASGFLLFSPPQYSETLGLDKLIILYRSWIGLVFLLSSTLLFSHAISQIWSWVTKKYGAKKRLISLKKRLGNLTVEEKKILNAYISNQTRTQVLDLENGIVNGLIQEGIIYRVSPIVRVTLTACNIQPWAWDFLNENKHLLSR